MPCKYFGVIKLSSDVWVSETEAVSGVVPSAALSASFEALGVQAQKTSELASARLRVIVFFMDRVLLFF